MDAMNDILPPNATPLERALESGGARAAGFDIANLLNAKNPLLTSASLLPFLAHEFRLDIWRTDWPDLKKRSVIRTAIFDKRLKGTLAGVRRYLDLLDATLIDFKVPPEGYFAAPDIPRDELDAYIEQHPKVRILLGSERGTWGDVDGIIADHAFVDEATTHIDDAGFLYGRKAVLSHKGVETPLRTATLSDTPGDRAREGVTIEQVRVPGRGAAFSHAGEFAVDDSFADAFDDPPRVYTYSLPRSYSHDASRLELTRVPVGFQPRDMRYRRESERGTDPAPTVFSEGFAGEGFVGVNDAPFLLADVIRLIDPTIPSPVVNSGSFSDFNRVGFPAHTAELQVDWRAKVPVRGAIFADISYAGDAPATAADTTRRDELLDAVLASKRLSDRVLVTFQTRRPRTLNDGIRLDQNTRLEAAVPFNL
jgi:hypothetical protein